MKIGIDARMFSTRFTGIGRCTYELTKRFFELRPDWEWVLWMNQPEYDQYDFPPNVKKILVNAKHYSFAEQLKFCWMIRKEKCDLVHFMNFNVPLLYRKKYIATIHDLTLWHYPGYGLKAKVEQPFYKLAMYNTAISARHLVAVSQNTKKDLVALPGVKEQKITTIYNGIDLDGFSGVTEEDVMASKQQFGIDGEYLFYAGNWKIHKNVGFLVKAFAKIQKNHPGLKLVLTGKKDRSAEDVEALVASLGLEDVVFLVGYVSERDLQVLYKGAKAFVFPTLYEGFGLPPLEAMAFETPVITSDRSSLSEVCGDAALYFDPEDEPAFVTKIERFLSDETITKDLVEKGKYHVQKFNWDKAAEAFLEVYEKTI